MGKGLFITFEGIDGSGKSTAARLVAERLSSSYKVWSTCEPTKTWLGNVVRKSHDEPVSPFTEAFLFMADRATHCLEIKKKIEEGNIVISDRYADSSFAYQAVALEPLIEDPMKFLIECHKPFLIIPDITFLLIAEPEFCLTRVTTRNNGNGLSKFEKIEYLRKVHNNYLKLAQTEKRIRIIDATKKQDEIADEIIGILKNLLDHTN
ncbi:MAG: dTMP kinase [Thermoplasmata archaeon]